MAGVLFPSLWRWFLEALRWPSETVHAGSASGDFIILFIVFSLGAKNQSPD